MGQKSTNQAGSGAADRALRLAFIAPEFVTDYLDGGGLASYLNRITAALAEQGHEVEVFLTSERTPAVVMHGQVRVERVHPWAGGSAGIFARKCVSALGFGVLASSYYRSGRMAAAVERRQRVAAFDVVQSADYMALGLVLRRRLGRVHVVRCSSLAELYNQIDFVQSRVARWHERLERTVMRRADRCYAPSRFVANHYVERHGIEVGVVRPPMKLEAEPAAEVPCGLPERFLLHFGQLRTRKGTGWLCAALKQAFARDPSLRLVWIGRGDFDEVARHLDSMGSEHRAKVQVLYSMPKPQLYAVLQRAEAAVLPSLVDNLPNAVSECMLLGIPVIGTRGASIDELVEAGVTGELVAPEDVAGLAEAMLKVWQGRSTAKKGFGWQGAIAEEMEPAHAVRHLLQFAGVLPP